MIDGLSGPPPAGRDPAGAVAVVPVKDFEVAKARLREVIPGPLRSTLARAMMQDVLAALAEAGLGRLVVTPDASVAALAESCGARVLLEAQGAGHTAAVAAGVRACREVGASAMLTVPADLPCLTPDEIRTVLTAARSTRPSAVFVPSRNGLGTNVACLAPPDALSLRFGEPSFADHLAAARASGIEPVVLHLPGAALDIDRPEDLDALLLDGPATRAARVLHAGGFRSPARPPRLEVLGIGGLPDVRPGDDLAALVLATAASQGTPLQTGDVVVVSQKVVSKAEGRLVRLDDVAPSPFARALGESLKKDPRLVEVILGESRRIVRMDRGILITETRPGQVCANAGVDQSNVGSGWVSLLPVDPDASAQTLLERFRHLAGIVVAVVVADTFGRPWREGLQNVAIGVAGFRPLQSYLGMTDAHGYQLQATVLAVADELAGAAELVMGKLDRVPVAVVRGYGFVPAHGTARELLRDPAQDLFR